MMIAKILGDTWSRTGKTARGRKSNLQSVQKGGHSALCKRDGHVSTKCCLTVKIPTKEEKKISWWLLQILELPPSPTQYLRFELFFSPSFSFFLRDEEVGMDVSWFRCCPNVPSPLPQMFPLENHPQVSCASLNLRGRGAPGAT